ncbi:MAG: hypothetical protein AMXMBFR64_31580 [Myxococcales bacterium]
MCEAALRSTLALLALVAGCRGGTAHGREDSPVVEAVRPAARAALPGAQRAAPSDAAQGGPPGAGAPAEAPAPVTSPDLEAPKDAAEIEQPALVLALAGSDADVRRTAAEALARLGTPAAAAALAPHAVPGDPLEAVAVAGLGWAGGHADRLLAALRSADAEARNAAAVAVGAAATAHWDRPLAFALQVDRPEVKVAALVAIGLAGRTTLLPDVARLSRDPDPAVREAAFDALRRLPLRGAALLLAEAGQPPAPPPAEGEAPPPCPPMPSDSAALEALLANPSAPIVERALAAVALGRQGRTAPLSVAGAAWPRLVRAAALLARHGAGDLIPPEDVALERRALEVGRLAHSALAHPLDACLRFGDRGAPPGAVPKEEP